MGLYTALREGTVSGARRTALEAEAAEACWAVVDLVPHVAATLEGLAAVFPPNQVLRAARYNALLLPLPLLLPGVACACVLALL